MPELPEIETVRLQLSKVLVGVEICDIEVLKPKSVSGDWDLVKGKKIEGISRKGKMLQIDLSEDISVAIHFKMTGQLVYQKDTNKNRKIELNERIVGGHPTADFVGELPSKHTRAVFNFEDGSKMYFNDQRMFGWVKIGHKSDIEKEKFLQSLGPEPFDLTEEEFAKLISKSKKPIKLVLMDQQIICGVGNIYANDGLWEARVNPRRPANELTPNQLKEIYKGVVKVLREGIKYGGATAADAKYIDLHGVGGHYQEHFRVYDREGEGCLRKDGVVHKFMLSGRGTYFCPGCQS